MASYATRYSYIGKDVAVAIGIGYLFPIGDCKSGKHTNCKTCCVGFPILSV